MEKLITNTRGGLKCDNLNCDWEDMSIDIKDYPKWLNAACPKCGENVLTENDYNNFKKILIAVELVNNLSPEELEALTSEIDIEEVKKSALFKDATGLEHLSMTDAITEIAFETHGKLKVTHLRKIEE